MLRSHPPVAAAIAARPRRQVDARTSCSKRNVIAVFICFLFGADGRFACAFISGAPSDHEARCWTTVVSSKRDKARGAGNFSSAS